MDGTSLLSTLTQSGAALAAIIAGLLIARLVALVGERHALERRIRELIEIRDERENDRARAKQAILDDAGWRFINNVENDLIAAGGVGDVKDFSQHYPAGFSEDELRPYFDKLVAKISELKEAIEFDRLCAERPDDWDELLASLPVRFPDLIDRHRVEGLVNAAAKSWPQPPMVGWMRYETYTAVVNLPSPADATHQAARMGIDAANRRQLQKDEADAEAALVVAELELTHAKKALGSVSRPEGLGLAMSVVIGIAIAGIVLPLLRMTFGPPQLSISERTIFAGLFVASLVAFFVYLWIEMRRITRPVDQLSNSES
jgi:hypothetical protein